MFDSNQFTVECVTFTRVNLSRWTLTRLFRQVEIRGGQTCNELLASKFHLSFFNLTEFQHFKIDKASETFCNDIKHLNNNFRYRHFNKLSWTSSIMSKLFRSLWLKIGIKIYPKRYSYWNISFSFYQCWFNRVNYKILPPNYVSQFSCKCKFPWNLKCKTFFPRARKNLIPNLTSGRARCIHQNWSQNHTDREFIYFFNATT